MTTSDRLTLPDVNVLVALTNPAHVAHHEAHRWLDDVVRFATTPVTELGLVRLLLNPAVTGQQVTSVVALDILRRIRADSRAEFLPDDGSLADAAVDVTGLAGHRQVTDWHLVDLARRHDAVLVTFDARLVRSLLPTDAAHVRSLG